MTATFNNPNPLHNKFHPSNKFSTKSNRYWAIESSLPRIGNQNIDEGKIKYEDNDFWGYDGTEWKSFTKLNDSLSLFYSDSDNDGYGNPSNAVIGTAAPPVFVNNSQDCDDFRPSFNPAQMDIPDAAFMDNNCDGIDGDTSFAVFVSPLGDDSNDGLSPSTSLIFSKKVGNLIHLKI